MAIKYKLKVKFLGGMMPMYGKCQHGTIKLAHAEDIQEILQSPTCVNLWVSTRIHKLSHLFSYAMTLNWILLFA